LWFAAYDVEAVERKVTELKATKNAQSSEEAGILDVSTHCS